MVTMPDITTPPFSIVRSDGEPTIYVNRFKPTDLDSLTACLSAGRSIHDGTLRVQWPYTQEHARTFLDNYEKRTGDGHLLAIRLGSPDAPVAGAVGLDPEPLPRDRTTPLDPCPHVQWEVGYWLATVHRGKGIVPLVLEHVVKRLAWLQRDSVARVELGCYVDNLASRRVAEKAGFTLEGVRRGAVVKNGQVRDDCVYSWIPHRDGPPNEAP